MKGPIPYLSVVFLLLFLCISGALAQETGCLRCHNGIEPISQVEEMKELPCTFCHKGDPDGKTVNEAHQGMYANPSDYRVVDEVCGVCHGGIVANSRKSIHATMAGIISATRYTWGAQETKNALYAVYNVKDHDGTVPQDRGALPSLEQLPSYDPSRPEGPKNTPADDYLREECLRCHLYSYGSERPGDYRSSGCAACHMVYGDDGAYRGGDETIKRHPVPRPLKHTITTVIPPQQCIHCHNRGGRTGVSYIGTMESDGYGSPWSDKPSIKGGVKLHGKYYNHLAPDVHFEKGIYCIDCHTGQDLHGDGNIYSKKEQAVEIECQDCHGTSKSYSSLKTSWGNPMRRLRREGNRFFLITSLGKRLPVPQVKDVVARTGTLANTAMGMEGHMKRMECYACHARWAPQCYGCHAQQDLSTPSKDWMNVKVSEDPSQAGRAANRKDGVYKWRETRSYLRWESPELGINSEGKVAPFIPGCQVIFTQIGPDGKARVHNMVFTTYDGFSGIASNPIQPHTVSREARSCEDCHANRKTLGLGSGIYRIRANGVNLDFELEQIVDRNGRQLQATSHDDARPFNKEELQRMERINVCASCHGFMSDPDFWQRAKGLERSALSSGAHDKLLKNIMKGAAER